MNPQTARLPVTLAGVFLIFSSHVAIADDQDLSVKDYLEFEQVADPQISPDGSQVVYTRRWVDQKADRRVSVLWLSLIHI